MTDVVTPKPGTFKPLETASRIGNFGFLFLALGPPVGSLLLWLIAGLFFAGHSILQLRIGEAVVGLFGLVALSFIGILVAYFVSGVAAFLTGLIVGVASALPLGRVGLYTLAAVVGGALSALIMIGMPGDLFYGQPDLTRPIYAALGAAAAVVCTHFGWKKRLSAPS